MESGFRCEARERESFVIDYELSICAKPTSERARRATKPPDSDERAPRAYPAIHPTSDGTTGSNTTRRAGPRKSSGVTRSSPPPASIVKPPAGCSPTSIKRPARSGSSKANPFIRARAAATAPKDRRQSTRSTTPSESSTHSSALAREAKGNGIEQPGTKCSTRSHQRFARR